MEVEEDAVEEAVVKVQAVSTVGVEEAAAAAQRTRRECAWSCHISLNMVREREIERTGEGGDGGVVPVHGRPF